MLRHPREARSCYYGFKNVYFIPSPQAGFRVVISTMKRSQIKIRSLVPVLFLLSLESASWVAAQQDPICPYAKYVVNNVHTACLPANKSCEITKSGVNNAEQQTIISMLNNIRSKVAQGKQTGAKGVTLPPASDMRQLMWNKELAVIAQAHTDQCNLNFDCFDCRAVEEYYVGENIYYYFYNFLPTRVDWAGVINQWAKDSSKLTSVLAGQYDISSYTQMIWGVTKDVGCGFTRIKSVQGSRRFIDFFTCLFGPAGNYKELNIYMPGTACTDCSYRNTCCDLTCQSKNVPVDHPGLCKIGQ